MSGGGLVAGLREIKIKSNIQIILERKNESDYISNILFTVSEPGKEFFGADVNSGYKGFNIIWGLETAKHISSKFGKDIIHLDKLMYSSEQGVLIEFQSLVSNSEIHNFIESDSDTDPRPNLV